jgi:hypothetical protein
VGSLQGAKFRGGFVAQAFARAGHAEDEVRAGEVVPQPFERFVRRRGENFENGAG